MFYCYEKVNGLFSEVVEMTMHLTLRILDGKRLLDRLLFGSELGTLVLSKTILVASVSILVAALALLSGNGVDGHFESLGRSCTIESVISKLLAKNV